MDISNELGTVAISDEVLCTIAGVAAKEVDGVADLSATLGSNIKDLIIKKYAGKGVAITAGEGGLNVTVNIIVKYRANVQEVAVKVQDEVRTAISDMTNYDVAAVNVNVVNVQIEEEK